MSKRHLQRAVDDPAEQIRKSSNNLLGRVYWTLIDRLGITTASFNASLNKYVRDPKNVPEQTAHKRSEKMSNITAELTNYHRMSWNKFFEGLKAAEIFRVRITFEVWRGKRQLYASTVVDTELSEVNTTIQEDPDDSTKGVNNVDTTN